MRKSSGRRGAEKAESSGKVKLEAVADMETGGRRSELRGKGRREGEEKGLKRESGGVCTKKVLACMVAGYASKKVGALIEFPRSVTPGTGG